VEPSHLAAFLYPFLIALVAGAAGGLRSAALAGEASEPWGRRTLGVWGGGVRMLALGLVLSFVGLLVLAALDPTTTADYFRGAFNGGAARGTVLVGHHVLLSPNQSMWVLVPSMGGSLNLSIAGSNVELLSYSHFPEHLSLTGGPTSGFGTPIPSVQGGTAPAGYFLFLLVPLLSVLIGGRSGAARGSVRARPEAAMVGALAGVVFAVLVALVALISTIGLAVSVDVAGFHTGGSGRSRPWRRPRTCPRVRASRQGRLRCLLRPLLRPDRRRRSDDAAAVPLWVDLRRLRTSRVIQECQDDRDRRADDQHRPRGPSISVAVDEERHQAAEEAEQDRRQPPHRIDRALPKLTRAQRSARSRNGSRRGRAGLRPARAEADLGAVRFPGAVLRPGLLPPVVGPREARHRRLSSGSVPDTEEAVAVSQEVPAAGVRVLECLVSAQWSPFEECTATTMIVMMPPATPIHPRTMPAIASPRPV
jgi:hypothetical protein